MSEFKIYLLAESCGEFLSCAMMEERICQKFGAVKSIENGEERRIFEMEGKGKIFLTSWREKPQDLIKEETLAQMWDFPGASDLLSNCGWYAECTVLTEKNSGVAADCECRTALLMDALALLPALFPDCTAFYIASSGRLFPREKVEECPVPKEERFIYYGVNARFFSGENGEMLIDTIGMSAMELPDLQYHFQGIEPDLVVNHAYSMLFYLCAGGAVPENGETVDGIAQEGIDENIRWICRRETAIMPPARNVIDIYMNEYAAGDRHTDVL